MSRGDPQLVAAPVFVIGSIALAFQLVQYVSTAALGTPLAILLGTTGLFLLVSTIWAAAAGQSFVACFAGTFGGFWLSYSLLVLALIHGWFAVPAEDVQRTVAIFAIAFASFFFFLTLASLRLPAVYPAIFGLVVVALCLVATAYLMTPVDTDILKVAGYVVFVFAGLGMSLSWTVMNLSLGGPAFPPLGPTFIKPPTHPHEAPREGTETP
ncbi:MAG TPA: GPR1/FUN34/YaaH family transporter [Miltoncostaeaceae bacterium]|jgi:succinate-acetate transporter protein|nr:GPR1/FUN34/YaaH family transporter [Miltoncostaeaceae bacterium]